MKHVLFSILLLSAVFAFGSCGDGSHVGSGSGFDTLTLTPTAEELAVALWGSVETSSGTSRFVARAVERLLIQAALDLGLEERAQYEEFLLQEQCEGGGRATVSGRGTDDDVEFEVELDNCAAVLEWDGTEYAETLDGTLTAHILGEMRDVHTVENTAELTVSGDLGFAVACDLRATACEYDRFTDDSAFDGECDFLDGDGSRITGTTNMLESAMFIGFPYD